MNLTLFTGGRFLDPEKDRLLEGIEVLVEGLSDETIEGLGSNGLHDTRVRHGSSGWS